MTSDYRPEVATNLDGKTVAQALAGYWQYLIEHWRQAPELAIASAYFNPGGFSLVADQLEAAGNVRLLLGVEPDVAEEVSRVRHLTPGVLPQDDSRRRLRDALSTHHQEMETDRNLLSFTRDQDALIKRMLAWIESGNVEVRRLEDRFLHGKAFIVETGRNGVLAGSSNFTRAGLSRNVELNLGHYQPHVVGEVVDWFDQLWDESQPYDLAALYETRFTVHLPYVVYLRMLWERYCHELEREEKEPPGLPLIGFQRDGLTRARDYLARHNGVLIADGVGLGKTFLAGELMRAAVQDARQRVLLIAPAALRDGPWQQFQQEYDQFGLAGIQCVSFQQLASDYRLGGTGGKVLWHDPNDYAMVVIDEAHAYRNTDTARSETLRQLLTGTPPKKVVLLTATPVNNSLWDLHSLLSYFIRNDAAFLNAGVPSLRAHFAEAQAEDPDDLSPDKLFDILDAVAVRRTRRFIKTQYPDQKMLKGDREITITFPEPRVLRVEYDLEPQLPGIFERFAHALGVDPDDPGNPLPAPDEFHYDSEERLTLARYAPSAFLIEHDPDAYELQAAGLLRSGLLKRFESSTHAFALTCRTMAASHTKFLDALDAGWVLTGDALGAWERTDSDDFDPEIVGGGRHEPADRFNADGLRDAVTNDRDLLIAFAELVESIDNLNDPKLDQLIEQLVAITHQADREAVDTADARTKRKVLIFTYYADTARWIRQRLDHAVATDARMEPYANRITLVTGAEGDKEDAMFGFAPDSADAPEGWGDNYDILVSTDVLAEGVNLQQARNIINYDLPWNPMRLVQRHGRIDRIGSPHPRVFLRCFFPGKMLDGLLGLEEALQRKITQAAKSIGVEGEIVPGSKSDDRVFTHTRAQIAALKAEDATLFEEAGEAGAMSGEEFRRELERGFEDVTLRRQVLELPWVAGTGKAVDGQVGYVFCARVGDQERPLFRWVPLHPDRTIATADVTGDTLACLSRASCAATTPAAMPDEALDTAYAAWEAARDDIIAWWQTNADPRAIAPAIPKPMRDAVAFLEANPPAGMEPERLYRILDAISAPYDPRTQRMMRQALRSEGTDQQRASAIVELVNELGLQPADPTEPLPEITADDVHLVCWMALV